MLVTTTGALGQSIPVLVTTTDALEPVLVTTTDALGPVLVTTADALGPVLVTTTGALGQSIPVLVTTTGALGQSIPVLVTTTDALGHFQTGYLQNSGWEGMGDVVSARYKLALLLVVPQSHTDTVSEYYHCTVNCIILCTNIGELDTED